MSHRSLRFNTLDEGLVEAERLVAAGADSPPGGFSLAETLAHCAQSIDYAIDGFPELRPAAFRATVGSFALRVFSWRGAMSHDLSAPIPGAPTLATPLGMAGALQRLRASAERFEAHDGAFEPHFAYGRLDKRQYALANAMHMANHFSTFELTSRHPHGR